MKLFKSFFLLLAAVLLPAMASAQVINGDLNHNNALDVGDVTMVIDGYLTGETELIETRADPFTVDNSLIVGTWYKSTTESITFNADGTTDYLAGCTYKFRPQLGTVLFYDSTGRPVSLLKIEDVTSDYLVTSLGASITVYTAAQPASITLSETSLSLKPDEYVRLTATVAPANAGDVTWTSSDESVATVIAGFVTAVSEGTATITASVGTATATCEVIVGRGHTTYSVNGVSFNMVYVYGGTFLMGAQKTDASGTNYDADAFDDEAPVHNVTLSDYQIGETEVTQALWVAVMGSNPSDWLGDNLPVENVDWDDCQEFITKLNQLTGKTFRLPTEAEWEFAARGGMKSQGYKYSGSNTIGDVAWYTENSSNKTHEVGTKQANELGLYDMSGNVREWCQDWYSSSYYTSAAVANPTGPTTGSNRVIRGGSWNSAARSCRVAYRGSSTPTSTFYNLGLRLAL